jgi:hypothetical protein
MERAEHSIRASVLPTYDREALPVAASSMSRSECRRLAVIGAVIGLTCTVVCALLGLLICAAVFGG